MAGVAGSGKTTEGLLVARRMGWVFADGDEFHPAANLAKMRAGVPLTDEDRWPWLRTIAGWMDEKARAGESAVVACSALRRSYRDLLLGANPEVRMVFLVIPHDADQARLSHRQGHFFPSQLLDSQFAALEMPDPSEHVLIVATTGTAEQTADEVMRRLGLLPSADGEPHPAP
jgi:gluconokinase